MDDEMLRKYVNLIQFMSGEVGEAAEHFHTAVVRSKNDEVIESEGPLTVKMEVVRAATELDKLSWCLHQLTSLVDIDE